MLLQHMVEALVQQRCLSGFLAQLRMSSWNGSEIISDFMNI